MIYPVKLDPLAEAVHWSCRRKLAPIGGKGGVQPDSDSDTILLPRILEHCTDPATTEIVIGGHGPRVFSVSNYLDYLNQLFLPGERRCDERHLRI